MTMPLDGIRVLEMANFVSGPFAATILADFGADVVRVELPGRIDDSRRTGGVEQADPERSPTFAAHLGRNKRSVALDVRTPRGRELILGLVRQSDVLVENFQPGRLEAWDIGPDVLHAANSGMVILRISGWGQEGPLAGRPGFDRVAQAFAGLTHLNGEPDRPPMPAGLVLADYGAAVWGALGVLLALRERERSGFGQVVDTSLYESLLPALNEIPVRYALHGEVRQREGGHYQGSPLLQVFRTSDERWLQVAAVGQAGFEGLMRAIGRKDLIGEPAYLTNDDRERSRDALQAIVAVWVAGHTLEQCLAELDAERVACSAVQDIAQLSAHPHVKARQSFTTVEDSSYGPLPVVAPVPRLQRTPGLIRTSGPAPGEHTAEVLGELLGMSLEELSRLSAEGVIGNP